jgi:chromosome partitioning protein
LGIDETPRLHDTAQKARKPKRFPDHDMPTISVVSRKGGSGKSTLATNLAAYFALHNMAITLGDLDHQQSMRVWLGRRPRAAPSIASWVADASTLSRPPSGLQNLVIDTPGGLTGLELAKTVMLSDAILLPICGSVFDRESASDCWAELRQHPRVKSGRCAVAAVGMRLDARTHADLITRDWAASVQLEFITSIRTTQLYVRAVENGLSIFDMPLSVSETDREQWRPIIRWVGEKVFHVKDDGTMVSKVAQGVPSKLPPNAVRLPVNRHILGKVEPAGLKEDVGVVRFLSSLLKRQIR